MKQNQNLQSLDVLKKFRIIFGSMRLHFADVENKCGISGSQVWVLNVILKNPEIGVTEVAEKLSIHQSTCSQLVDKLAKNGLLTKLRSTNDQRRVVLMLTELGRNTIKLAPGPAEGILPIALQSMSKMNLTALENALEDLINRLNAKDSKLAGKPLSDL